MRSGFVTLVGRPNVGKSSLVNAICGAKVSIVSDKPQTTRHRVRGVLNRPDVQLVFVDTPGLHKPVTALGQRVNNTAIESVADLERGVDLVCLVIDATAPFGDGDRWVAKHLDMREAIVIVNKIDRASRDQVIAQLGATGQLGAAEYFPVSAHDRRGARTRWSITSSPTCPRGPPSSPSTPCATCRRSSGWPSWCASSCWR